MANDFHRQNRTVTRNVELFSSSECIAWLTVLNIEAVAIVIMNALTIIIYLKERILRKRSMYLVISLAVADMFVVHSLCLFEVFLSTSLCNKPCCYFFGADARTFSSIQASPHQKEDIWSSCCGCLVYSCPVYSYRFFPIFPGTLRYYSFVSTCGSSIILLVVIVLPFYYGCFLLVHCY